MSAFSRRRAMIGAAFATFAGVGAVATASPLASSSVSPAATADADLLAACAVFMKWDEIRGDLDDGEGDWEDMVDGDIDSIACDGWFGSLRQIVNMPATTREGLRAKANVLERSILGICTNGDVHEGLALSFARDVVSFTA